MHRTPAPEQRRRTTACAIEQALGIGITLQADPGQILVVEGDPLRHCFRLLTGILRLYKALPDGRRQVLAFLLPGEYFGVFGSERHGYSAEAIAPSTLARYRRAGLEAELDGSRALAQAVLELASRELEHTRAQLLLLGRKSAEEKVASFLIALSARTAGGAGVIHLPMSRQDMADYLGLTIETVSRTLTRLRQDGLIALLRPQHVLLLEPERLQALAEGAA